MKLPLLAKRCHEAASFSLVLITLPCVTLLSGCQGQAQSTGTQVTLPTPTLRSALHSTDYAVNSEPPAPVSTEGVPIPTPTRRTVLPPGRGPCPVFVAQAGPPPLTPVSQTELAHSRDFGLWCYAATRNMYGLWASIGWDHTTVKAINAYAARNREMVGEIAKRGGKAMVEVTFRTYLEGGQFRRWVETNDFQLEEATLRLSRDWYSGIRVSPIIHASDLANLPNTPGTPTADGIPGFVDASGTVDAQHLPQLASDPLIFLLDVTPNLVRPDLIAAEIPGAEDVQVHYPASAFESMEDLGLDNFAR